MNDYYGKLPTRQDLSNLRIDAEDSLNSLYTKMLDYISDLESRNRNLERKNRELRGQLGKQLV